MNDADRFKLPFGPYRTPRFRYGRTVTCLVRGRVMVCGLRPYGRSRTRADSAAFSRTRPA